MTSSTFDTARAAERTGPPAEAHAEAALELTLQRGRFSAKTSPRYSSAPAMIENCSRRLTLCTSNEW